MSKPLFGRRDVLRAGGLFGAYNAIGGSPLNAFADTRPSHECVRDRLWLWGHFEGSHNQIWGLPADSRITPIEAAFYMGTPNVVMVGYQGKPALPLEQYAIPFRPLRQVIWSAVAAGGDTSNQEREAVLKLAEENPNFRGVQLDDFFGDRENGYKSALSSDQLKQLQARLKSGQKKLDLWVTLYTYQLDDHISEQLSYCDVITLWTWKAADLNSLEDNLKKTEKLSPSTRKILGCYMWDYGIKQPISVDAMRQQCEKGLEWLKQGRIEGIIFLASCICDLNLEAVEWTRNWIQQVGMQKLTPHRRGISGGRP